MAAARGFRNVRHDYGIFYTRSDEDPSLETPVDPDPISPDGGFHVFGNPFKPCRDVAFWSPHTNPFRVLLVEYDDGDVLAEGGGSLADPTDGSNPWEIVDGSLVYQASGNPMFSRLWRKISTGTIVDELTVDEIGAIGNVNGEDRLASVVVAILDGYGWGDWEPARV